MLSSRRLFLLLAWLLMPSSLHAGMPSMHLTELAVARMEAISFFIAAFALSALLLRWAWNTLARDFAWMPRLRYLQAVAVLVVSGLFVHVALSLIAGARELMTPGAWVRTGVTQQLAPPERDPTLWLETARIQALENLRDRLWQEALAHEGRLPANREASGVPANLWSGIHPDDEPLGYVPDRVIDQGSRIVAFEPDAFGATRFALLQDGRVIRLSATDLAQRLRAELNGSEMP